MPSCNIEGCICHLLGHMPIQVNKLSKNNSKKLHEEYQSISQSCILCVIKIQDIEP